MRLIHACLAAALITAPALADTYVVPAGVATGEVACPSKPLAYPAGSTIDARQVDAAHGAYTEQVNVDLPNAVLEAGSCHIAISGFENVEGSPNGTSIIGDGQANRLVGHSTHDYISGGGGDDYIESFAKGSVLFGGPGHDAFVTHGAMTTIPVIKTNAKGKRYTVKQTIDPVKDAEPGETVTRR